MSQDLFAAFGQAADYTSPDQGQGSDKEKQVSNDLFSEPPHTLDKTVAGFLSQESITESATFEDDDDFGDFEDASATVLVLNDVDISAPWREQKNVTKTTQQPLQQASAATSKSVPLSRPKEDKFGQHPFAGHMDLLFDAEEDEYNAGADELGDLSTNPEAAMAYSKMLVAETMAAQAKSQTKIPIKAKNLTEKSRNPAPFTTTLPSKSPVQYKPTVDNATTRPKDPDVLFDVDDQDPSSASGEDDDWGDFEEINNHLNVASQTQPAKGSLNRHNSPTIAMDLLSLEGDATKAPQATDQSGHKPSISREMRADDGEKTKYTIDESWDDFEVQSPEPGISAHSADVASTQSKSTPTKHPDQLPPSNIPPPIILLSRFPSLFSSADDALFNSLAKLPSQQKQMLLTHPATHQFLQTYISQCICLAYIVAGRKSRWKRDQHLAQSMRIGPAAAGSKSGMKLVGIDKSEMAKENREVLDTVRIYRAQMGKLQSAAAGARPGITSGPSTKLPAVPNISENMPVRALKPMEGGIPAPRPCAICGLKRDERVVHIDREIQDSFGEWWAEQPSMHVVCKDFWERESVKLKGR